MTIINRFLKDAPEVNLAQWGFAVDYATCRAGFIVSGDLEVAADLSPDAELELELGGCARWFNHGRVVRKLVHEISRVPS